LEIAVQSAENNTRMMYCHHITGSNNQSTLHLRDLFQTDAIDIAQEMLPLDASPHPSVWTNPPNHVPIETAHPLLLLTGVTIPRGI
jgi:hypothetical protein